MPRQSKRPFITKVLEQLAELDSLTYRPMFGCYGLYDRGVFFAIVNGEELFFRTDEQSRRQYVKRGMEPFIFREQQKSNNYYRVPDQIFDNPKLLKKWAETAISAQQTARKKKQYSGKRPASDRLKDLPVLLFLSMGLLAIVSFWGCERALAAPSKKAIHLIQVHTLSGSQSLYLAKDAIRLEHTNSGMVILTKAPFTEILVLNPVKKVYTRKETAKTIKRMQSVQIFASVTDQLSEMKWGPPKNDMFSGFKALVFKKTSPAKSWRKYWTLTEPVYPMHALELICAYGSGMPTIGGIPLKMEEYILHADRDGAMEDGTRPEIETVFKTKSIKEVTVPDSLFALPADYKRDARKGNVMQGTKNFHSFEQMMESPDFMFQSSQDKLKGTQLKDKKKRSSVRNISD